MSKNEANWLLGWMQKRLEQNRSVLALFIGPTGSGKSYAAITTALTFCPERFNIDNVVFNVQDFVRLMRYGNLQRGDVIVFDDAGLNINSRTWFSLQNNIFSMVTQSFRYRQIVTLVTTPDWSFIDAQVRSLFDVFFEATETQGLMKPFLHFPSPILGDRRPWRKYPQTQINGKLQRLSLIQFYPAPQSFLDQYEAKKKEQLEAHYEKFEKQLDFLEKEEEMKRKVVMKKIEAEKKKIEIDEEREKRNLEISEMIRRNVTYSEIATKYGISEKTVQRIARKL